MYTHVADWEEFKDLQRSFLIASVPDAEVPTDWVIFSVLFKEAAKGKGKIYYSRTFFPDRGNYTSDLDLYGWKYVNYVYKKFGTKKIRSFPVMTIVRLSLFHID